MKKAIAIALAALGSSAVMAQNVQIYGAIDTGFQQYNNGSEKITRAADSLYNSSRLGFTATEDLGGGLKASFRLEGGLAPSTGTMGSSTANQLFSRESYVALSGGFGEVRMGRTDVSRASEMDSLVNRSGNFGLTVNPGASVEGGADQSNVIKYISPNVKGAWVEIGTTTNNSGATADAGTDQTGVSLSYSANGLSAGVGYHKTDGAGVAAKDSKAFALGYDFGVAFVGVSHVTGDNSTTSDATSKATTARVTVPFSNGLKAHAIYGIGTDGSQSSANKGKGYTALVTKDLSKRTMLYAAYTSVDNDANSALYMTGTTVPGTRGYDTNAVSVGVSHLF